ncbi:MAG: hypothetical protein Q9P01_09390 [Anaerolineae bacterium]|nr:hypothetical protein [Anaerolineae bacterium]MDQ7035030.1 hypothetical protein [Anaerolineae bacterium]
MRFKQFTLLLMLVFSLLVMSGGTLAQETITLPEAITLVHEAYGDDVTILRGEYNTEDTCWEFELEDETLVCVDGTTGEFVNILATSKTLTPRFFILTGGALSIVLLVMVYFAVRKFVPQLLPRKKSGQVKGVSLDFHISSLNSFTLKLGAVAAFLAIQSITARWIQESLDDAPFAYDRFVRIVNINLEKSLPTWYSTMLLLFAAVLLALIVHKQVTDSYRGHWRGLSFIFLYLSIDEGVALHEELTIPLREALNVSGFLYFAWVIVGASFALIIGIFYLRFVFHLAPSIRYQILLGGTFYIMGALLIESFSASFYAETGTTLRFSAIGTVEEFFEMLGVIVFIRALLLYWQTHIDSGEKAGSFPEFSD